MRFEANSVRNLHMFYLAPVMMEAIEHERDPRPLMATLMTVEQLHHAHQYSLIDETFYGTPEAPRRQLAVVHCEKFEEEQVEPGRYKIMTHFLFAHAPADQSINDVSNMQTVLTFSTTHTFGPRDGAYHIARLTARTILDYLLHNKLPELSREPIEETAE